MSQQSIQGERQQAIATAQIASQADVDELARTVHPDIAICRGRGTHRYPVLSMRRMNFDERDWDFLLERRTGWCDDCKCVRQVQVYEPYEVRQGGRLLARVRRLFTFPEYRKHPETGEEYLQKGKGRFSSRAFADAQASAGLVHDQEGYGVVKAAIRKRKKLEREQTP
jgi:hypothetical protein